jgi:hypothetical protein
MRSLKVWAVIGVVIASGCRDEAKERAEAAAKAEAEAKVRAEVAAAEAKAKEEEEAQIAARVRKELEDAAAAKAKAEADAKEAAKKDMAANPDKYLEERDLGFYDKGIINDYRQLSKLTVDNKSAFKITDLKGNVEWLTSDGQAVGSSPFSLNGAIKAGDSETFSTDAGTLTAGTIEGAAFKAKITFTHAKVID